MKKQFGICERKLQNSEEIVSTAFKKCDLTNLSSILEEYDENVLEHYEEYIEINELWDRIKNEIKEKLEI